MPIALIRAKQPFLAWRLIFLLGAACLALSSCRSLTGDKVLYHRDGVQVGLQDDPSIARSTPPASNAHPAAFSPEEIAVLLGAVRVSGWSGTLMGYFETPRPIPLFEEADLRLVAAPIADAFQKASPAERVFFDLPDPKSAYGDATAGFVFVRDAFVHLGVTDHKAFARADTAGGDVKDPRDMKGMKLWVSAPYHAAEVPAPLQPHWAPFETVHISLDKNAILARPSNNTATTKPAAAGQSSRPSAATQQAQEPATIMPTPQPAVESEQELRLQIRELTQSNLDLRERLTEQTQQLKDLKEELTRLRRELDRTKPKSQPQKKLAP
jgi:hypothetical protein